jgi:5,10-methylenetetrahydromethanopterin reductase
VAELWRHGFPLPGKTEALARQVEAWGYDGLLLADSQNLVGDVYVELALAARATSTLRLGPGVTNPVTRHLAVTAGAVATLQAESGGRALLGFARGDSAVLQLGLPQATTAALARDVATLRGLLRGESTDAGRLNWLDPAIAPVEVDVAATGPRTIAAAVSSADRVSLNLSAEPERLRAALGAARAAGAQHVGAYVNVAVADDPAVARELVRGSAAIFAHFSSEHLDSVPEADREVIEHVGRDYDEARHGESVARQATLLPDDFLDRFAVVGTPDTVRDRLRELLALGLDHLVLVPGSRDTAAGDLARSDDLLAALLPDLR